MNQRLAVLLATAAAALAFPLAVTVAEEGAETDAGAKVPEGQKIFVDSGCTSCHSMKGQGIERKKTTASSAPTDSSAPTASPAPTATPATTASQPPDLSAVGIEHDQAWIFKFLQKTETLHGKKHMKSWKGTPEELSTLTRWLAEQKNAEAAGVKTSSKEAVDKANEAKEDAKEAKDQPQGSQGK